MRKRRQPKTQKRQPTRNFLADRKEAGSRSIYKMPFFWFGGILATCLTAYVGSVIQHEVKPLEDRFSELVCAMTTASIPIDQSRLTILVAPLVGDDELRSQTNRILQALRGERGFRIVPICNAIQFGQSKSNEDEENIALTKGRLLLSSNKGDLLLFGEVLKNNETLQVFAENEQGGCDLKAKPLVLNGGVISEGFGAETQKKLVALSLKEVASACNAPTNTDWQKFGSIIERLTPLIDNIGNYKQDDKYPIIASYLDGLYTLYLNTHNEKWLSLAKSTSEPMTKPPWSQEIRANIYYYRGAFLRINGANLGSIAVEVEAIDNINKAMSLNRVDTTTYFERAMANFALSKYEDCASDMVSAIKLGGDTVFANKIAGECMISGGNYTLGLSSLNKAIEKGGPDADIFNLKGIGEFKINDLDQASSDFERAFSMSHDKTYLENMTKTYSKQGNAEKELQALALYETMDDSSWAVLRAAELYSQRSRPELAMQKLSSAVSKWPKDPLVWNFRCWERLLQNLPVAEALQDCIAAFKLAPRNPNILDSLGHVYLKLGRFAEAKHTFDEAIGINAKSASSYFARGLARLEEGDTSGVDDLIEASKLDGKIEMEEARVGLKADRWRRP